MREIKFRAWQDNSYIYSNGSGVYKIKEFLSKCYEDCMLEQFTGILDINGKEIYEGDIFISLGLKYKVVFKWGAFVGVGVGHYDYMTYDRVADNYLEVIGNIHENTELINES